MPTPKEKTPKTRKEILTAQCVAKGIELDATETIADLEAKLAAHNAGWLATKEPEEGKTAFRVHYRTLLDANKHTHDCRAADIGEAHASCRAAVAEAHGENVRVFIDKVKVRGA